ncbi:hypothetical protein SBV1_1740032 [Verrucomicrobia bacterium]|nr:hypothetical protein SBV1_1740032 [Verrucomicrobiota bacterium]
MFQCVQRNRRVSHLRQVQAIENEVSQASFEKIAKPPAALIGFSQPALLKQLILSKFLYDSVRLLFEAGKGGYEKNCQRSPVRLDKALQRNLLRCCRLA